MGKIWYPCVHGVTATVECCIYPLLTHITHMHITDNTYIPNTPRRQCLTVFNPALHWRDVVYSTLLSIHGYLNFKEGFYSPCLHEVNIVKLRCTFFWPAACSTFNKFGKNIVQHIRHCFLIFDNDLLTNIFQFYFSKRDIFTMFFLETYLKTYRQENHPARRQNIQRIYVCAKFRKC